MFESKSCDVRKLVPGSIVVFAFPESGLANEQEHILSKINVGDALTVKTVDMGGFMTDLTFNEVAGRFNSVFFADL